MIGTNDVAFVRLVVVALILWTKLNLSIGEDSNNGDDLSNSTNETEDLINWDYETLVMVRWKIYDPVVDYENMRFDIRFPVSDYIEAQKHVRYDLFQSGLCGDPENIITDQDGFMESWITEDNTPPGPGIDESIKKIITLSNKLNPQTILKAKSYSEVETALGKKSTFDYCVRFSLWSGEGPSDPNASEVNHLKMTVSLSLDLDNDFRITDQQVAAKAKDENTSDDKFFVTTFFCDEKGNPKPMIDPLQQGSLVRVCVQPTEQAMEVGFRMQRIDNFIFEQGLTSQQAVSDGEAAPNRLTDLYCVAGAKQCSFRTLLFNYFFVNIPEATILGHGAATLQWGGEGVNRRHLGDSHLENSSVMKMGINEHIHERKLQTRSSQKSIELPSIPILSDDGGGRPPLRSNMNQKIWKQALVLVIILLVFTAVLLIPVVRLERSIKQNEINEENLDDMGQHEVIVSIESDEFSCRSIEHGSTGDSSDSETGDGVLHNIDNDQKEEKKRGDNDSDDSQDKEDSKEQKKRPWLSIIPEDRSVPSTARSILPLKV